MVLGRNKGTLHPIFQEDSEKHATIFIVFCLKDDFDSEIVSCAVDEKSNAGLERDEKGFGRSLQ